jgi:hypothetical protein
MPSKGRDACLAAAARHVDYHRLIAVTKALAL